MKLPIMADWRQLKIILVLVAVCFISFEVFVGIPLSKRAERIRTYPDLQQSLDALKINPSDPAALRGMAYQMSRRRKIPQSIGYLRKAIAVEPENTHNKFLLGIALYRAGQREESRRIFDELASSDNPEKEYAGQMMDKIKRDPN